MSEHQKHGVNFNFGGDHNFGFRVTVQGFELFYL